MKYSEAVAYLDSYVNYEKLPDYRWTQAAFRLDRMFRMLELLGDPHKSYPSVHVAGTKGKGSTCAFTASVLSSHGKKTGLYLSPHVLNLRERVSIDGRWIEEEDFAEIMSDLRPVIERVEKEMIPTTYFEILTALGMVYFARRGVEAAVLEVGIGGRLDATNVVTPVVSVIANIGFDHMDKLGNTLAEIAGEKCGIVKRGVPVVSSSQLPEAMEVIERICKERNSPLSVVGRDIRVSTDPDRPGTIRFETPDRTFTVEKLGIEGSHQRENAACALGAIEELGRAGVLEIDEGRVAEGLARTHLRARFELIPGEPYVLLDGAHNQDSLRALAESIKLTTELSGRKTVAVVGLAADKDLRSCLSILSEVADEFVFTTTSNPRAAPPEKLADVLSQVSAKPARVIKNNIEAFHAGRAVAGRDGLVVVAGSFYLAGDIASAMMEEDRGCGWAADAPSR